MRTKNDPTGALRSRSSAALHSKVTIRYITHSYEVTSKQNNKKKKTKKKREISQATNSCHHIVTGTILLFGVPASKILSSFLPIKSSSHITYFLVMTPWNHSVGCTPSNFNSGLWPTEEVLLDFGRVGGVILDETLARPGERDPGDFGCRRGHRNPLHYQDHCSRVQENIKVIRCNGDIDVSYCLLSYTMVSELKHA